MTKISKNKPNKKTIAALNYSMKHPEKLKSFENSDEAMKWLLSDKKKNIKRD